MPWSIHFIYVRIAAELKYIQCIYLFKSLHIQYKMHSRDGHFVQIDFSLPLFPFSKFANVDTIFEQNSLPGEKPLSIWHETFWQPGRIFWRFKKSKHGNICQALPSLRLTARTWKWMVGIDWNFFDFFSVGYVTFRECTLQETNISPKKWHFEDDFPNFPFGGIC